MNSKDLINELDFTNFNHYLLTSVSWVIYKSLQLILSQSLEDIDSTEHVYLIR